jgi:hypothetical protein
MAASGGGLSEDVHDGGLQLEEEIAFQMPLLRQIAQLSSGQFRSMLRMMSKRLCLRQTLLMLQERRAINLEVLTDDVNQALEVCACSSVQHVVGVLMASWKAQNRLSARGPGVDEQFLAEAQRVLQTHDAGPLPGLAAERLRRSPEWPGMSPEAREAGLAAAEAESAATVAAWAGSALADHRRRIDGAVPGAQEASSMDASSAADSGAMGLAPAADGSCLSSASQSLSAHPTVATVGSKRPLPEREEGPASAAPPSAEASVGSAAEGAHSIRSSSTIEGATRSHDAAGAGAGYSGDGVLSASAPPAKRARGLSPSSSSSPAAAEAAEAAAPAAPAAVANPSTTSPSVAPAQAALAAVAALTAATAPATAAAAAAGAAAGGSACASAGVLGGRAAANERAKAAKAAAKAAEMAARAERERAESAVYVRVQQLLISAFMGGGLPAAALPGSLPASGAALSVPLPAAGPAAAGSGGFSATAVAASGSGSGRDTGCELALADAASAAGPTAAAAVARDAASDAAVIAPGTAAVSSSSSSSGPLTWSRVHAAARLAQAQSLFAAMSSQRLRLAPNGRSFALLLRAALDAGDVPRSRGIMRELLASGCATADTLVLHMQPRFLAQLADAGALSELGIASSADAAFAALFAAPPLSHKWCFMVSLHQAAQGDQFGSKHGGVLISAPRAAAAAAGVDAAADAAAGSDVTADSGAREAAPAPQQQQWQHGRQSRKKGEGRGCDPQGSHSAPQGSHSVRQGSHSAPAPGTGASSLHDATTALANRSHPQPADHAWLTAPRPGRALLAAGHNHRFGIPKDPHIRVMHSEVHCMVQVYEAEQAAAARAAVAPTAAAPVMPSSAALAAALLPSSTSASSTAPLPSAVRGCEVYVVELDAAGIGYEEGIPCPMCACGLCSQGAAAAFYSAHDGLRRLAFSHRPALHCASYADALRRVYPERTSRPDTDVGLYSAIGAGSFWPLFAQLARAQAAADAILAGGSTVVRGAKAGAGAGAGTEAGAGAINAGAAASAGAETDAAALEGGAGHALAPAAGAGAAAASAGAAVITGTALGRVQRGVRKDAIRAARAIIRGEEPDASGAGACAAELP